MPRARVILHIASALALAACGKPKAHATRTSVEPAVQLPPATTAATGELVAEPSEHVATNVPDPNCPDCQKPDASPVRYPTRPSRLDPELLSDLRVTVDVTSHVLEDGVSILEKHRKDPAAALAALEAYKKANATRMEELSKKTKDMAERLRAAGFESDIPPEIKPEYEGRMQKVMDRLNAVRGAYAKQSAVLESFGAFIPTGQ